VSAEDWQTAARATEPRNTGRNVGSVPNMCPRGRETTFTPREVTHALSRPKDGPKCAAEGRCRPSIPRARLHDARPYRGISEAFEAPCEDCRPTCGPSSVPYRS
jgi:hypothetical protein